jgi:hypothetical protein
MALRRAGLYSTSYGVGYWRVTGSTTHWRQSQVPSRLARLLLVTCALNLPILFYETTH